MPEFELSLQEYSIIQEKIDRIGEFKFRVKGWIVTLVLALAVTGVTSKVPATAILVAGVLLIVAFWLVEKHQDALKQALGRRAYQLEQRIQRTPEGRRARAPSIASTMRSATKRMTPHLANAQPLFYALMLVIVVGAACIAAHARRDPESLRIVEPVQVRITEPNR